MLVRVNPFRGLVVTAACLLLSLGFAAAASASSNCPECDQYQLVIPDPRGGGGSDGRSAPPASAGGGDSSQTGSGSAPADQGGASSSQSGARRDTTTTRSERRKQRGGDRGGKGSTKDEVDDSLVEETASPEAALPAQQDLDYSEPSTATAALAQFANPLTLIVVVAMGVSLWFARRRGEQGGS